MAAKLNLSESSDVDPSSLNDQSVSSRSSNRSLRVAEKERRKIEAEDPFVLALKYFCDGRKTGADGGVLLLPTAVKLISCLGFIR